MVGRVHLEILSYQTCFVLITQYTQLAHALNNFLLCFPFTDSLISLYSVHILILPGGIFLWHQFSMKYTV
jgi:hypothetical protein